MPDSCLRILDSKGTTMGSRPSDKNVLGCFLLTTLFRGASARIRISVQTSFRLSVTMSLSKASGGTELNVITAQVSNKRQHPFPSHRYAPMIWKKRTIHISQFAVTIGSWEKIVMIIQDFHRFLLIMNAIFSRLCAPCCAICVNT